MVEPETGADTLDERAARKVTALWAGVTVLGVLAGYVGVLLANSRHFYTDDTESQYVPLWVDIGHRLRAGEFPTIVPEDWMTGNFLVEGQGSVFNPPQLLVSFIAPSVDNLLILATVVKLLYSFALALGVYRVCLEYGARPPWAAVAGVAMCFSGWLLFFDQATWVLGLAGTAWLAHAWASAVRYARGKSGPIPLFVFLFFAITLGYVWPSVECCVMLAAVIAGEGIYRRSIAPSLRILAAAACAGLAGCMTYLPSLLSSDVTWREAEDRVKNDGFMTIPWSESLNVSLPSTRPSFTSWFGLVQPFPVVYIAWFVVPALAFIAWRRVGGGLRELSGILIFAGLILTWTAGPAAFGPLRWPVRMLPMLALSVLVLICVLLSRYGTIRNVKARYPVALGLIGYLLLRSISSAPSDRIWKHIGAAVVVALLTAGAVLVVKRFGVVAACAGIVVSITPIAYYQVAESYPHPMSWNLPDRASAAQALFPDFDGTTLQLGNSQLFPGDAKDLEGVYSSLVVGYYAKILDLTYVNGYTPIGHQAFGSRYCMKWDGSTCPEAYGTLFSIEPETGQRYVDLLKVDRIVLMRLIYPDERQKPPPAGWHWVDYPPNDKWIWVLERDGGPVSTQNGRISYTSGVDARSTSESDRTSTARVTSATGGEVVFARLAWPGYHVTLDGHDVDYHEVDDSYLAVDIPAGTDDAELVVTWVPPGLYLGIAGLVAGIAGIVVLHLLYRRRPATVPEAPQSLSIV